MAKFSLTSLFEQLTGKLNRKDEIIYRTTRRYDANGKVVLEGKHAYTQVDKRNFKKKPPRGAEKRNMDIMVEAQRLTNQYLSSDSSDLTELRERFDKQLATGKPANNLLPANPMPKHPCSEKQANRRFTPSSTASSMPSSMPAFANRQATTNKLVRIN